MSDLQRARAHLRECRERLYRVRRNFSGYERYEESALLAALSWLWEEQEKARAENKAEFSKWLDGIIAERFT